ncbi:hypothetical protein CANCADRAFT_33061 [Tortispora caseinolytica NRRL Y-17796]|uniref:phenylalanine--tRNA ligase n=1 Tax=Tortispora caseinolytica NRRL Y-17796 TaxID=767744 RepID=A0A1E4T9R5_9ASCO|nr:hypothetical protein CANCADRAFT_33061 [Tortispora caseinolytica NRRL Y-17796]
MDLQSSILHKLNDLGTIDDSALAFPDLEPSQVQAALNSLASRDMVKFQQLEVEQWELTKEAQEIVENGSHEFRLLAEVTKAVGGLKISEVGAKLGPGGRIGQATAFKNGWIKKDGDVLVASDKTPTEDVVAENLAYIKKHQTFHDDKVLADLRKRKLISKVKKISFAIQKGEKFSLEIKQLETDLTAEMIQNGSWKEAEFKSYNFDTDGALPLSGAFHPLNKVREEFRQIFFSMGFTEMPTNQYVESGFWNFDTLFVPQQHPARDLQDTFYIKDPVRADEPEDKQYLNNVKRVHEGGAFDSIGYRYDWSAEETLKLVLRTHTTATSGRMLHALAKDPKPVRYFSIDRVFRNEAVDATHLAEFHQIEGVIADYDISLGDLIGFMDAFFSRMGVTNLRFKPAYNPYTEPSLEIFSWHEGLGKWVEIGNSGMFRPEMLEPMGLPKNLRVLGWGLSLERPTMIKYGVSNIRELLGHKVSLEFIESNPAVRLDERLV